MPDIMIKIKSDQQGNWFSSNQQNESSFEHVLSRIKSDEVKILFINHDWSQPFEIPSSNAQHLSTLPCMIQVFIDNPGLVHKDNIEFLGSQKVRAIIPYNHDFFKSSEINRLLSTFDCLQVYVQIKSDSACDYSHLPVKKFTNFMGYILSFDRPDYFSCPSAFSFEEADERFKLLESVLLKLSVPGANYSFSFHCGMPLCFFNAKQLGKLVHYPIKFPLSFCSPVLYLDSSGDVKYCSGFCFGNGINFLEMDSFFRVKEKMYEQIIPFNSFCECGIASDCQSRLTNACGGGAMKRVADGWM